MQSEISECAVSVSYDITSTHTYMLLYLLIDDFH